MYQIKSLVRKFKKVFSVDHSEGNILDYYQKEILQAEEVSRKIKSWVGNNDYEKISIGENCNSAWYLKKTNNKIASYPYDWIFSSPEIVLHTLQDDFKIFLNKEYIYSAGKNSAGHSYYHSRIFNHRNPLKSDEDYDYYKRSIDRLNKVLFDQKSILFVCTVLNEYEKRPGWSKGFDRKFARPQKQTLETFSDLIAYLKSVNPNIKFVFINQFTESTIEITETIFDDCVLWVDFKSSGMNDGVKYIETIDDTLSTILYSGLAK